MSDQDYPHGYVDTPTGKRIGLTAPKTIANVPLGSSAWNPTAGEGFASIEYDPNSSAYTFEAHDGANSVYIDTDAESLRILASTIEFLLANNEESPDA